MPVSEEYSGMEYDLASDSYTNGIVTYTGYCNPQNSSSGFYQIEIVNKYPIGLNIDGTESIIVSLIANKINNKKAKVYGGFTWYEIY